MGFNTHDWPLFLKLGLLIQETYLMWACASYVATRTQELIEWEKRDEEMIFLVVLLITEEDSIIDDLLS